MQQIVFIDRYNTSIDNCYTSFITMKNNSVHSMKIMKILMKNKFEFEVSMWG